VILDCVLCHDPHTGVVQLRSGTETTDSMRQLPFPTARNFNHVLSCEECPYRHG
jgi:hypothetical protein